MAENLNIGIRIDGVFDQIDNDIIEKYCYDNLNGYCDVYGGLYQWGEVMQYNLEEGAQGLCPNGWHVPTEIEWTILVDYLGGEPIAGGKMKDAITGLWIYPNTGATNESGFTGLPAGRRFNNEMFDSQGIYADFWSSTITNDPSFTFGIILYYNSGYAAEWSQYIKLGIQLRCIKD